MKKITLSLILISTFMLLSSCVIVADDDWDWHNYHDFTFVNDTQYRIADWYLRTSDGKQKAKSDNYVEVKPNSSSTLHDVYEDYYQVYMSYSYYPDKYYYSVNYVYLDTDTKYYLKSNDFYARSAASKTSEENKIILIDDKGNEIELIMQEAE